MPAYVYVVIVVGMVLWFIPFLLTGFNFKAPQTVDRRARWGILLQGVSYAIIWQGSFWTRSPQTWQLAISFLLIALANLLSWSATRALGKQLRLDAAVGADHQLIRSGPYQIVRHPIYTSMLCMILGMGIVIASPLLLLLAILVFIIGTEIRIRVEDALLEARFAQTFRDYQRTTPRYIPFVW
jgi:protein-S-isoprenylcysteine O-methyltransferase Ste14